MHRIEICGNIASGKTTLSRSLEACGLSAVEEKYLKNPFIEAFYTNPSFFSFETEITFLLQHYHAIKTANSKATFTCDYSLTLDKAYADVTLPPTRRDIFLSIADELESEIGQPSKIIYLKCPAEVLLSRIKERNRPFEASIDIKYLEALSKAIDLRMVERSKRIEVEVVNSHEVNFVSGVEEIASLNQFCIA